MEGGSTWCSSALTQTANSIAPAAEIMYTARSATWRMPAGSYLLNLSRGTVVDLDAVADALREGRLRGAAVDEYAHTHQLPQLSVAELAHWLALHPAD